MAITKPHEPKLSLGVVPAEEQRIIDVVSDELSRAILETIGPDIEILLCDTYYDVASDSVKVSLKVKDKYNAIHFITTNVA